MAQLPSLAGQFSALIFSTIILISQAYSRFQPYFKTNRILSKLLLQVAFLLLGVVESVPQQTARGMRFNFDVENVLTNNAVVPRHVSLNQYIASSYGKENESAEPEDDAQFKTFHAGER